MKKLLYYLPQSAACFFIVLFIYAAVSKVLDFENFQVQIGQSPVLSSYASFIAYAVIISEFAVVVLLSFRKTLLTGLYISVALMTAFTVYIYIILNFSDFIPCSCGGILEKLGWTEHLVFNISFVILGIAAILTERKNSGRNLKITLIILAATNLTAILLITILFLSSEYAFKKENNFTRRFLPTPILKDASVDLQNDHYYFAGSDGQNIYLGNKFSPQILTTIGSDMKTVTSNKILPDNMNFSFKNLKVQVKAPYYYLSDGTVPVIYRGKLGNMNVKTVSYNEAFFNQIEIIDSATFALRTFNTENRTLSIASLKLNAKPKVKLYPGILQKQTDGVFDSDGQLIYAEESRRLIYMYAYRNQFLIYNKYFEAEGKFNTIDTTSVAKIQTKALKNGLHKMTAPPVTVNQKISAYNNVAVIHSKLRGRSESLKSWKNSSTLDVYSTANHEYFGSFRIDRIGKLFMQDYLVTEHFFYVLIGNQLIKYRYRSPLKEYIRG